MCRLYRPYATRTLSDEQRFVVTAYGRGIAEGRTELPVVWEDILDHGTLAELLAQLQAGPDSGATMSSLVNAGGTDARAADARRRHLMWLVKYGLAEIH